MTPDPLAAPWPLMPRTFPNQVPSGPLGLWFQKLPHKVLLATYLVVLVLSVHPCDDVFKCIAQAWATAIPRIFVANTKPAWGVRPSQSDHRFATATPWLLPGGARHHHVHVRQGASPHTSARPDEVRH